MSITTAIKGTIQPNFAIKPKEFFYVMASDGLNSLFTSQFTVLIIIFFVNWTQLSVSEY